MATKKSEKLKKADFEVNENSLLPVNPLMQNVMITPEEENEQKVELIEEVQNLAVLNKQVLEVEQKKARLEIELKKITTSRKITDVINQLIDLGMSEEILKTVSENIKTPFDLKLFSDALKNLTDTRNKNADSIMQDEWGGRKKTKIMAAFKAPTGEQMMISAELPSND